MQWEGFLPPSFVTFIHMLIQICTEYLLAIGSVLSPLGIEMEVSKVTEAMLGSKTCTQPCTQYLKAMQDAM